MYTCLQLFLCKLNIILDICVCARVQRLKIVGQAYIVNQAILCARDRALCVNVVNTCACTFVFVVSNVRLRYEGLQLYFFISLYHDVLRINTFNEILCYDKCGSTQAIQACVLFMTKRVQFITYHIQTTFVYVGLRIEYSLLHIIGYLCLHRPAYYL